MMKKLLPPLFGESPRAIDTIPATVNIRQRPDSQLPADHVALLAFVMLDTLVDLQRHVLPTDGLLLLIHGVDGSGHDVGSLSNKALVHTEEMVPSVHPELDELEYVGRRDRGDLCRPRAGGGSRRGWDSSESRMQCMPPGACLMVVRYSWRSYFWKESEFYVPLRDLEHDTLDAELRLDFAIL